MKNHSNESNLLTNLWSKEIEQQILILRARSTNREISGKNNNHSWTFDLNQFQPNNLKFEINVQSTLFTKQIDLIINRRI